MPLRALLFLDRWLQFGLTTAALIGATILGIKRVISSDAVVALYSNALGYALGSRAKRPGYEDDEGGHHAA